MLTDLKYAFRMLIKAPVFAVIAILTLALGIGANSAIFSVIDTVLLRPLPFKNPDEIVNVWGRYPTDNGKVRGNVHSFPDYLDMRDQSQSFVAMASYTRTGGTLSLAEDAKSLEGLAITPEVFDVLGVQPLLGRAFTKEDAKNEADRVVVLTYPLWKSAFASDPKIVGQQITISARPHTVVGVMPPGWKFPIEDEHIDYALPLEYLGQQFLTNRGSHFLTVVGRLKPGVAPQTAEAELTSIASRLSKQYPDTNLNFIGTAVVKLHTDVVGDVRPALLVLLGAVGLVLLIACANVANLLLARAASRSREIAIRTALGASRALVIRQLLCESLLLAVLGGCAGLLLAWWGVDLLSAAGPQGLPHLGHIKVNTTVCLFTFVLAIGSTLLFGLIPALQVSRPAVNESLQQGAKGSTGGLHTNRLRAFLVVSQVSLSLLLLAGAGLLIKSFYNLRATNPGFDPVRVMTLSITLPRIRYPEVDQQIRTYDRIMEKLATIPGVEAAGGVNPLPLGQNQRSSSFMPSGAAPLPRGNHPGASYLLVKPDYFKTMKIPVLQGRDFTRADTKDSPLVIMINEAFAQKHFAGKNPIGQQVMIDQPENKFNTHEVVGVVGNTRHDSLAEPQGPEMYVPFAQDPGRSLDVVLRVSSTNLVGLNSDVKRTIREVDKDLYVPTLEPMTAFVATHLAQPRFNMMLLAVFAGVAMVLAAIGIYGVIAYSVTQRTREIGIRMALGAQKTQMLGMVLRQSMTLVILGIAIGFIVALISTRVLKSLLYGVGTNDLSIYALVILLLSLAALLASYVPARRAMKVDPMVALRYE
ncbi:MAG TPA: ABC transporter permease [Chthoniobacterales bacterium]|jgi:putative ABC transport system permease protein|nr:ABC transporter permease [Chthoniobacterales bacterium]